MLQPLSQPPSDLVTFIAESRRLTPSEAASLLADWLLRYEPATLARRPVPRAA